MKQEEKQLLLIDLCARLPYGVKVLYKEEVCYIESFSPSDGKVLLRGETGIMFPDITDELFADISEVKPYLRPLSSMTEEEWEDYQKIKKIDWVFGDINGTFINAGLIVDWLNKNHFDYRGLIPLGLALEATEDMYKNNIK